MKELVLNPMSSAFQKAVIGLSIARLEKQTGIKGLKAEFFKALNKENTEENIVMPDSFDPLGKAEKDGITSALYVSSYKMEGNWASSPSYHVHIHSYDTKDGEVINSGHSLSFRTNSLGVFEQASSGTVTHNDKLFSLAAKSSQIEAFEKIIKSQYKPK